MGIKMKGEEKIENETYVVSDPESFVDENLKLTYH